jgi:hypothetical protein
MTPLAQKIMRHSSRDKELIEVKKSLERGHCFEITAIKSLIEPVVRNITSQDGRQAKFFLSGQFIFLPDSECWLEWNTSSHSRGGALITAVSDTQATITPFVELGNSIEGLPSGAFPLGKSHLFGTVYAHESIIESEDEMAKAAYVFQYVGAYVALQMINTPKLLGRKQHQPHAGLQREIARNKGMVGKFPLRAWTEIELDVSPKWAGDKVHDVRLSCSKALHFVRAHPRYVGDRWVKVREHWRGDPSLGIKRQRYVMKETKH